jgi:molybdopterin-guanine dinucleotide biosynthesis adapter protein
VTSRRRTVPIVAFSGQSGAGKTTLLERLLPALARRGIRVGALKHSGHPHSFDVPGKDSDRLRRAGAVAVAVQGPSGLAWFGPALRGGARAMARLLPPCDLVLAEGFKSERLPRVEVHRRAVGGPFLCARDRGVVAVVSDEPPPRRLPTFHPDDVEGLAGFLAERLRRRARGRVPGGRSST